MGEALAVLAALLFALGTVLQSRRLARRVNLVHSHGAPAPVGFFTGRSTPCDIATLLVGFAVGTLVTVLSVQHRRREASGAAARRSVSGVAEILPAMMSRCTCDVPPAMPAALLHSHWRAHGPASAEEGRVR